LTGLIIKPVTGIFDAAAKTTEGIKNTVTYFEDKPNENRERNVRPVYGPEGNNLSFSRIIIGYFIEYVP
jgi:vacuolar protein sorting-associated protein 13A/C